MPPTRTERDALGEVAIPSGALYGAHTARAAENFAISGRRMPREFIAALGVIKQAAASAHKLAGRLDAARADAIIAAAQEVADGALDEHFVVDVFQTGSGTSTHMNANEVIANRACELLGASAGETDRVHPNDHVNMGQSSNDVIPTAMHVAAAHALHHDLVPALRALRDRLDAKAGQFDAVVKLGRTHLMDAVPIRLGQEFAGYASQVRNALSMLGTAVGWLCELPIGGTAVGTGLNAAPGLAESICRIVEEVYELPFREAACHFDAQGARDAAVFASGALRTVALALGKIASDVRLLGSGPRGGLGELRLPAVQPGSSIMPGKVNPVMCEAVIQAACHVVGCDAAIAAAATGGVGSLLELNVAMPLIAVNLLEAAKVLAGATRAFDARCIAGLEADEGRCRRLVERSLAMVTALAPRLGYDRAAEVARQAHDSGKTIREVCAEQDLLAADEMEQLLDPRRQTGP
jgi:fumarate hydratase class II